MTASAPTWLPDPLEIRPISGPLDVEVTVPGSKSITNRALVCAALADGRSVLDGALDADDVEAMVGILRSLGVDVAVDGTTITVDGVGGRTGGSGGSLDARQSGTTSRFTAPLLLLGPGPRVLTGHPQMLARPMGATITALRELGASVSELEAHGHLPIEISPSRAGGRVAIPGDASSQFLSGLLLVGPCLDDGLVIELTTDLVSVPYVELTISVMESFGATVRRPDPRTYVVEPTGYRPSRYDIEPDASAASYPLAAAAVCGGRVKVLGLGTDPLQGDARFADVLAEMGAQVFRDASGIEVSVERGTLRGGTFDLRHISDTAPTLACVAPFAADPVVVTGIGFIRHKEIDRVAAVAGELTRCGVEAREDPDGWTIRPGAPVPAVVRTYEDHRMAMSFSLLGIGGRGVSIAGPGCVAKTFPTWWEVLEVIAPGSVPALGAGEHPLPGQ